MTNFEIFKSYPEFASFSELAITAEKVCSRDPKACALYCFQALDGAVKWMYSVDAFFSSRLLWPFGLINSSSE